MLLPEGDENSIGSILKRTQDQIELLRQQVSPSIEPLRALVAQSDAYNRTIADKLRLSFVIPDYSEGLAALVADVRADAETSTSIPLLETRDLPYLPRVEPYAYLEDRIEELTDEVRSLRAELREKDEETRLRVVQTQHEVHRLWEALDEPPPEDELLT